MSSMAQKEQKYVKDKETCLNEQMNTHKKVNITGKRKRKRKQLKV